MKMILHGREATIIVDPTNHWPDIGAGDMLDTCGFLAPWVLDYPALLQGDTLKEHMMASYGFPVPEMKGGTVTDELTYLYPEDPPLEPILHIKLANGVEFVQWQYAMCAFKESADADWYVTRMD